MKILAIETSCDETAAAVVENGKVILSNIVASQAKEHEKFGGVVPELASRRHSENILAVVKNALFDAKCELQDVDAIAVTYAPGLVGALLVGVSFAKGLCMAAKKPLIPVHHIAGHIAANYLAENPPKPPYLCLVASGGHSHIIIVEEYTKFRVIGQTRDDAAGEAYDKVARVLGFPYPGGVHVDKAAQLGNANAFSLPYPKVTASSQNAQYENYDFSFSGLKTAVVNIVHNHEQKGQNGIVLNKNDMAAAFQKTICEILVGNTIRAALDFGFADVAVAGGVAANSCVRELLTLEAGKLGFNLYIPPVSLCGDNAAMIGTQAYFDFKAGKTADESLNALASLKIC